MRAGRAASAALLLVAGLVAAPEALPVPRPPASHGARQQATAPELVRAQALLATDPAAAARILADLVAREPDNVAAWRLLGRAHYQARAWDEAIGAWEQVLRLAPGDPQALYNTGVLWALRGDRERAFEWLGRARDTGRFDMSRAAIDPGLAALVDDPRMTAILPAPEIFDDPFVEPVEVVGEWRGEAANDQFGWIARSLGDVDGDGAHDFVTSAPTKALDGASAGRVYVYSSRGGELLWHADGGSGDNLGQGLDAAGDVDGDGVGDVVAGAPGAGYVRVYSGRDGSTLHTFTGTSAERFGTAVSAGDVDGDHRIDIIVGAPGATLGPSGGSDDPGRVVVYSGADGGQLVEWTGERPGDQFGAIVAGDPRFGSALVVVGAPGAGPAGNGRAYVYEGTGAARFTVEADDTGAALGAMFAAVPGDVDGDGQADVYVSDWANAARGASTGRVYVHAGADGARLFTWTGEAAGDGFGTSPSNAGDVDGDGHADFIVGAWQHASGAISGGRAYLYSGRDGSLLRTFTNKTPGDTFGFDAVGIDDVDGDGTVDLLITSGWSAVNGFHSGRVFIVSSGVERRGPSVERGAPSVAGGAPSVAGGRAADRHAFDFWIGEWDVTVRNVQSDGSWDDVAAAHARVYSLLDGKAVLELWDGRTPFGGDDLRLAALTTKGFSLRYFDERRQRWVLALNWPGPDTPGFSKLEGTFRHGRGEFFRRGFRRDTGAEVLVRYTFSDIASDRLRWDDGYSEDGGQTWGAGAVFEFTRTRATPRWPDAGEDAVTYDTGTLCRERTFRDFDALEGTWSGGFEAPGEEGPAANATLTAYRVLDGCALLALVRREGSEGGRQALEEVLLISYLPALEEWVALHLDSRPDSGYELAAGRFEGDRIAFTTVRPAPRSDIGAWSRALDGDDGHPSVDRRRLWTLGADALAITVLERDRDAGSWRPAGSYELIRAR